MSYRPDENAQTILAEKGWLQGAIIGGVAYGVDFTLAVFVLYLLWRQMSPHQESEKLVRIGLIVYTTLVFVLATLFMASLAQFTQMAFIDNRNYPGGPNQYEIDMFHVPESELGNVAFVISNWLSDAMILWRCLVIYRNCRYPPWLILSLPILMFTSSLILGSFWLRQITVASPFVAGLDWTIPYLSVSLALNIVITVFIVIRLFVHRYSVRKVLGSQHATEYTTVAAIVIESAAIYSGFSIVELVLLGVGNPLSTTFLQALCQVQTASSLLIVFRVAQGRAWTANTAKQLISSRSRYPSIPMTPRTQADDGIYDGASTIAIPSPRIKIASVDMRALSSELKM